MKKILLALLLLIFSSTLFAQTLQWAKQIGGSSADLSYSVAVDALGNVYSAGGFVGTVDFDPGLGTFNITSFSYDGFISKLDASGNFVWAKNFGGNSYVEVYCVAIDTFGNVYTTGFFEYTADFDPGPGVFNLTSTPSWGDAFISKLDSSGNFVWAKLLGGNNENIGISITTDDSGNVYSTGYFQSITDFDPGPGSYNLSALGYEDVYVSKLDSSGNMIWTKQLGGNGTFLEEWGNDILVDDSGNVYISGVHDYWADFDPGLGTFIFNSPGGFICKLNSAGNFAWAKHIERVPYWSSSSIALDNSNNVYITSSFSDTCTTFNFISAGGQDAFVAKYDSSGNFIWAKQLGSPFDDYGLSLTVDDSANIFIKGEFGGTIDLDPGPSIFNLTPTGSRDFFITKFDSSGNFIWGGQIEGESGLNGYYNDGSSLTSDATGSIYTTGSFSGVGDFDISNGVFNMTSFGMSDVAIVKMGSLPNSVSENSLVNSFSISPNPSSGIFTIQMDDVRGQMEDGKIEIYNTLVEMVFSSPITNDLMTIDLSKARKGIYFCTITTQSGTATRKIVIQ